MKKIITFLLIATLTASSALIATANDDVMLISAPVEEADKTPACITPYATDAKVEAEDGMTVVWGKDEIGEDIRFVVTDETLVIDEKGDKAEVKDGVAFTAVIGADAPAPLVLPPMYYPEVIVIDTDADSLAAADLFTKTEEGIYLAKSEALSISVGDTKIIDKDGEAFADSIDGKKLLVSYKMATRSIPPMAIPEIVIVLDAEEVKGEEMDFSKIAVGDKTFDVVEKSGVDMLPVRAVSEALGLDVEWNQDFQAVTVGTVQMGVNFKLGVNQYNKARMTPFTLEAAPVAETTEAGGVTYVPVSFFTDVLGCETSVDSGVLTLTRA